MFHDRLPARPGYAHNVESRLALLKPFRVQKELGGADHLLLFSRLHGLERRAETIIGTGFDFEMHDAAITFMAGKAILRVFFIELYHDFVPRYLREYGRRGD